MTPNCEPVQVIAETLPIKMGGIVRVANTRPYAPTKQYGWKYNKCALETIPAQIADIDAILPEGSRLQ